MAYILNKTCGDCVLFIRIDSTKEGRCRRYPPVEVSPAELLGNYPIVHILTPSCGEYAPKP